MGFDPTPFFESNLAVQIHVIAAVTAFFLGALVLFRRKGGPRHRSMGKVWVGLMAVVALSSFFINELRTWGPFSPIHLLSIWTLGALVYAVWMIRKRRILAHQYTMIGLYSGGLVFAGILTFARDLLMNRIFFPAQDNSWIPAISDLPGGILFPMFGAVCLFAVIFMWSLYGGASNVRGSGSPQSKSE